MLKTPGNTGEKLYFAINVLNRTHSCHHKALSDTSKRIVEVEITTHYQLIRTIFLPTWGFEILLLVFKAGRCRRRMVPPGGRVRR